MTIIAVKKEKNKIILGSDSQTTRWQNDLHSWLQLIKTKKWVRRLTPLECERLQWFDDLWTYWAIEKQRYKQMWNAITVRVAKKIFDNLFLQNGNIWNNWKITT